MVKNKDICGFLSSFDTPEYRTTFKELSKGSNGYLVDSEDLGYNFDKIKQTLLGGNKLRSADALKVKNGTIYFIEFKTGFSKMVSMRNFDYSIWECSTTHNCCKDGLKYFKQYQNSTLEVYKMSNFIKLLESYLTFEKFILPHCAEGDFQHRVKYIAVVDAVKDAPVDAMESVLNSLGDLHNTSNRIESFKKSLKKYILKDSTGQDVLYDEVDVYMKEEFDALFCCV